MPYSVEETRDFTVYKVDNFFTFQDMDALTEQFDQLLEKDPAARVLLDFSAQTGYEEATIKAAFRRIDKGFPRSLKMAILYAGEGGIYKHVLAMLAAAMPEVAKFFSSRAEAEAWLKS
ncbi:MAG: STAS/SEC14 domain-containing protein [bacterium]|nr:STAS/SEC14 domain-containing protein [bacterium]